MSLNGPQDLQALLLPLTDPQLDLNSELISFIWTDGEEDKAGGDEESERAADAIFWRGGKAPRTRERTAPSLRV